MDRSFSPPAPDLATSGGAAFPDGSAPGRSAKLGADKPRADKPRAEKNLLFRVNLLGHTLWVVYLMVMCGPIMITNITAHSEELTLPISEQHPIHSLHIGLRPETAVIKPGWDLALNFAWANTAISSEDVVIDAETRNLGLELRYAPTEQLEAYVLVPVVWRGGGILDEGIDSWHDFFSLPEGDRNELEPDQYEVRIRDGSSLEDRGVELGIVRLGGKRTLFRSETVTVSAFSEIGLPTAAVDYGHDSLDLQLGVRADLEISPWVTGFGGLSGTHPLDGSSSGFRFSSFYGQGYLGVAVDLSSTVRGYVSALGSTPRVENVSSLDESSLYTDFGLLYSPGGDLSYGVGLRENFIGRDSTTDFDLLFGATLTL